MYIGRSFHKFVSHTAAICSCSASSHPRKIFLLSVVPVCIPVYCTVLCRAVVCPVLSCISIELLYSFTVSADDTVRT